MDRIRQTGQHTGAGMTVPIDMEEDKMIMESIEGLQIIYELALEAERLQNRAERLKDAVIEVVDQRFLDEEAQLEEKVRRVDKYLKGLQVPDNLIDRARYVPKRNVFGAPEPSKRQIRDFEELKRLQQRASQLRRESTKIVPDEDKRRDAIILMDAVNTICRVVQREAEWYPMEYFDREYVGGAIVLLKGGSVSTLADAFECVKQMSKNKK